MFRAITWFLLAIAAFLSLSTLAKAQEGRVGLAPYLAYEKPSISGVTGYDLLFHGEAVLPVTPVLPIIPVGRNADALALRVRAAITGSGSFKPIGPGSKEQKELHERLRRERDHERHDERYHSDLLDEYPNARSTDEEGEWDITRQIFSFGDGVLHKISPTRENGLQYIFKLVSVTQGSWFLVDSSEAKGGKNAPQFLGIDLWRNPRPVGDTNGIQPFWCETLPEGIITDDMSNSEARAALRKWQLQVAVDIGYIPGDASDPTAAPAPKRSTSPKTKPTSTPDVSEGDGRSMARRNTSPAPKSYHVKFDSTPIPITRSLTARPGFLRITVSDPTAKVNVHLQFTNEVVASDGKKDRDFYRELVKGDEPLDIGRGDKGAKIFVRYNGVIEIYDVNGKAVKN